MSLTCDNVLGMSKMIQVRHVPDAVHRRLKARAAEEGLSLSDYLKRELSRISQLPTLAEMAERLAALPPVSLPETGAEAVRAIRNGR